MRALILSLLLSSTAVAAPPLWGGLTPGPHPVGFRQLEVRDPARPFWTPRDFDGKPRTGDLARPIRISVWYPATATTLPTMTLGDYVALMGVEDRLGPVTPERARAGQEALFAFELLRDLSPSQRDALLALATLAHAGAPAARGKFPVVLYSLGSAAVGSTTPELLASHGYIVAQAPRLGPWAGAPLDARDPVDLSTKMADLDRVVTALAELPEADTGNLSTVGFSAGGQWAALEAMRDPRVRAVVSLDTVLLFDDGGARAFRRHPQFDWGALRVPVLHVIRKPWVEKEDPTAWGAMRFAERISVRYDDPALAHLDFQSIGLAVTLVGGRPAEAAAVRRAFPLWNRQTLAFLDAHQQGKPTAWPAATPGVVVSRLPAEPAPISGAEFFNLTAERGSAGALEAIRRGRRPGPAEADLNFAGYSLLLSGRAKESIPLFELAAERAPTSANAQDSLADAYLAAGERARAVAATERAQALLDADKRMAPERRTAIQESIDARRARLR